MYSAMLNSSDLTPLAICLQNARQFVDFHEATLRDVERVSGLTLFAGQPVSQPDQLHMGHAQLVTQLPEFSPPQDWYPRESAGK